MSRILHENRAESFTILHASVKDSGSKRANSVENRPNPSQSFTWFGEGFGKDFRGQKPLKNREKLSLFINPSILHAHPRAMRAHACKGAVKDLFGEGSALRYRPPAPRARACGSTTCVRLGTSGPKSTGDARGNSRQGHHSLFYLTELPRSEK